MGTATDATVPGDDRFSELELTKYGITLDDEGFHPFDPAERSWNESWFWDWFDEDGARAGHCRIGMFPGQDRLWVWLYLLRPGPDGTPEWLCIEEPRLDLAGLQRPRLAYDRAGLTAVWRARRPLLEGRLAVRGRARTVSGPRAGRMVDVDVSVDVTAAGVPHSTGQGNVEGHESEAYDARRFEQPIDVAVEVTADGVTDRYDGRGERDHSWGPRAWNIEWTFFAVSRPQERLQFVEVRIKGFDEPIGVGYRQTPEGAHEVSKVLLPVSAHDDLAKAFSGRVEVTAEDGTFVSGDIEVLTAHEMDISHCLEPARGTRYHRALVRIVPEQGGAPFVGWLEDNRFFPDDPDRP
jgi:hypothetical protein